MDEMEDTEKQMAHIEFPLQDHNVFCDRNFW